MNILDSRKDYYDYLVGIYGKDPKIFLDRRGFTRPYENINDDDYGFSIHVCDTTFDGVYKEGKYYFGEAIKSIGEKYESYSNKGNEEYDVTLKKKEYGYSREPYRYKKYTAKTYPYKKDNINTKENCPIVMTIEEGLHSRNTYHYPLLKEMGFGSVIPPHDMYIALTQWCSPKEDHTDTRTDKEKISSHGFDLIHSFRNTK